MVVVALEVCPPLAAPPPVLVEVPCDAVVVKVLGTRIKAPKLARYSAALLAEAWLRRYTFEANVPALELRASGPTMIVLPTSLACSPALVSTMLNAVRNFSRTNVAVTGGLAFLPSLVFCIPPATPVDCELSTPLVSKTNPYLPIRAIDCRAIEAGTPLKVSVNSGPFTST